MRLLSFCLFFYGFSHLALAQKAVLEGVQHELDSLRKKLPKEKVYVHLDKDKYILGDTIWYKAYMMDGLTGGASLLSGIVYIELFDGNGELVQQSRLQAVVGSAHGEFNLDPEKVGSGRFFLRAYTHWMKNFGEDHYFGQYIDVVGDHQQQWGVKVAPVQIRDSTSTKQADLALSIYPFKGAVIPRDAVTLKLLNNKEKVVAQSGARPDGAGNMQFSLAISNKIDVANLNLVLETAQGRMASFPWAQVVEQSYDVQFLPEGGAWVAGIPTTIGIKAIDAFGKGVQVQGEVLDEKNEVLTTFETLHMGMGRIDLPALGLGKHQARVRFLDGSERVYAMPAMKAQGVTLHHEPGSPTGDMVITVRHHLPKVPEQTKKLMLVGQARGIMCYGAIYSYDKEEHTIRLPRHYFPEGVVRFSIRELDGSPLCERLVYNHVHQQPLQITVLPSKAYYATRDSVALDLTVTDTLGQPVQGNFSLAVTDDGQYTLNPHAPNILDYHHLTSELEGNVEDPNFYFSADEKAKQAMDNLLLTQGWVRYDVPLLAKDVLFDPEPMFTIEGSVKNSFGKGVANSNVVVLTTGKAFFMADTLTDKQGYFRFEDIPPFDASSFVVQARNRRNKSFNVGIEMKEFTAAALPRWTPLPVKSWYVGLDTTMQRQIRDQHAYQRNVSIARHGYDVNAIRLREVEVAANVVVKASKNLNGAGGADEVLGEEVMLEAGDKDLLQIIKEKVGGFTVGYIGKVPDAKAVFKIQNRVTKLIFDGVDLDFFFESFTGQSNEKLLFMESYLKNFSGNDVLGVEVMHSSKYSSNYHTRFLEPMERMNMGLDPPTYLEITTRAGHGPFMKRTPGVAHFRPIPFTWPKEFYRPKYPIAPGDNGYEDVRSTIHWEPMVITDQKGKASVSFYTSDRKGNYTVRVQGSDLQGGLGVDTSKLIVK